MASEVVQVALVVELGARRVVASLKFVIPALVRAEDGVVVDVADAEDHEIGRHDGEQALVGGADLEARLGLKKVLERQFSPVVA